MKLKIGVIFAFTFFLIVVLFNSLMVFAQTEVWDIVQVSACGTELSETTGSINFLVVSPPAGSDIPNTIKVESFETEENYTINLSPGDDVLVVMTARNVLSIEPIPDTNNFIVTFDGSSNWLWVNAGPVPEFPTIIIIPLFMTLTLIAIIYKRRKHTD